MSHHVLNLGPFLLDGGALFGVVPRSMWGKLFHVDAENRIALALNATLIRASDRIILVDAGNPDSADRLVRQLRLLSIHPQDVTDVVFTHLHYDHTGGAFRKDGENLVPLFPHATYHMTAQELSDALVPDERTRHFYRSDIASWISRTGQCHTVSENTMLTDEVELVPSPGHTLGHLAVWVHGAEPVLIPGDLIPTSHHLNVHYMTGFDENTRLNIQTKKALLHTASLRPTRVVFYHDPKIPSAVIEREGNRYRTR